MAWSFWIDRGGTFTDVVGRSPSGALVARKVLSEQPGLPGDPAVQAIARILQCPPGQPLPCGLVDEVRLGTTVATNALLEGQGSPVLLLINRGLADLLVIGDQHRPDLFALEIQRPFPLALRVLEVAGRLAADGQELEPLQLDAELAGSIRQAMADGYQSCAVALLHSYRWGRHEQQLAAWLEPFGFDAVVQSHQLCPRPRLLARAQTAVVEAAVAPVLQPYLQQVAKALGPGTSLAVMRSSGALESPDGLHAKDTILSGPAGGMVGALAAASWLGCPVLGFDMGGTSTDVFYADPAAAVIERSPETEIAGITLLAPRLPIHTVAAGGGSLLKFDGERFRVGPQSAGANPGPASYRRGGRLAVTDANVMLGKVQPRYFPQVFGPNADEPLSYEAAASQFDELAVQTGRPAEVVAEGFINIAVQQMANAIKKISVARGYDVTRYTLQCFGGAGGQHACLVADALGMTRVFVHPMAGVLSAYGMGLADQNVIREQTIELKLTANALPDIAQTLTDLAATAEAELQRQQVNTGHVTTHRRAHVRYEGSDAALIVPFGTLEQIQAGFEAAYRQRFAFLMQGKGLVVEAVSVESVIAGDAAAEPLYARHEPREVPRRETVRMYSGGQWHDAALVVREDLQAGDIIPGPAIIAEKNATTVVEPGWEAHLTVLDHLVLDRRAERTITFAAGTTVDPVLLEVFNNLFMNIAEQMGLQLQNTAYSVNIKERLDFSCALFDTAGNLIANAPHMPVHLGSMGQSIKTVIRENAGQMEPGNVYVLNDPYHGGTHLPDITVITPVYLSTSAGASAEPSFYVGSRGHHADIGGTTPGSMPPFSTRIEEEGVQINNELLVERGVLREAEMVALLKSGPYPSRNPQQNMADLKAQIAANEKGVQELRKMVEQFGLSTVLAYMNHVQDNAEESVRRVITRLKNGEFTLPLDNGAQIKVAIRVDTKNRSAEIDFSGTSPQQSNNFNAPTAVCMAAVLYVFRTLVDDDIPLNAGCLKPLKVIIPPGSMLNPNPPASVVAGNVETSTCITNALYGALSVMAAGQCTMNNFTFGNDKYQYYETISGGSGAGGVTDAQGHLVGGFNGTSLVQAHMTNSRLTDPEILEFRFPVRLESYEIRANSGGAGQWQGGNGGIRRVRFLEAMTASMLSNGRKNGAFGMAGGQPGQVGQNLVVRSDGRIETLGHIGQADMLPGDVFEIHTPGGGGFGVA